MAGFAAPPGGRTPDWQFLQCFGERVAGEDIQDADIISAVEFDRDGTHLATGDRGGRVVMFVAGASDDGPSTSEALGLDARAPPPPPRGRRRDRGGAPPPEYTYLTEFQSHEPEFDYLKSLEIEEKVNRIKWVPGSGGGSGGQACASSSSSSHRGGSSSGPRLLLSTNDKTVKLWRVSERRVPTLAAGYDATTGAALSAAAVAAASLQGGVVVESTTCGAPGGVSAPAPWSIAASSRAGEARAPPAPTTANGLAGGGKKGGLGRKGTGGGATAAPPPPPPSALPYTLAVPRVVALDTVIASRCVRTFGGAHAYHIHSLSLCSDGETFLSADDLRIHLWHLDRPADGAWVTTDMKPASMDDLIEVITAAEFHPTDCATYVYASSKGTLRLADMRASALCDRPACVLSAPEALLGGGGPASVAAAPSAGLGAGAAPPAAPRSFFSEIVASVSDVKFLAGAGEGGRRLIARDFMGLSIWDLAMPTHPLATYPVHDALRSRLADLYENDCIFDKFGVAVAGDGSGAATGTYSNFFRVVPSAGGGGGGGGGADAGTLLEASRDPQRLMRGGGRGGGGGAAMLRPSPARAWPNSAAAAALGGGGGADSGGADPGADPAVVGADLTAKMLHLAWHPQDNILAAAACNSLYMFHA